MDGKMDTPQLKEALGESSVLIKPLKEAAEPTNPLLVLRAVHQEKRVALTARHNRF